MIVGIGGISNAGKSKLALRISDHYSSKKVAILCQDDYVFPKNQIPLIREHVDWECPESIDFDKFEKIVQDTLTINDIVIVEGIFAFYKENFNKHMDKKIFLNLDHKIFFSRKNKDLRWGKEPEWYVQHIWDSHHRYCDNNTPKDALKIKANEDIDLKIVIDFLEKINVK